MGIELTSTLFTTKRSYTTSVWYTEVIYPKIALRFDPNNYPNLGETTFTRHFSSKIF